MTKFKKKISKLYIKYLFTFVSLTLLLCSILIFFAFNYITNLHKEETDKYKLLTIENLNSTIDDEFFWCEQTALKISSDTEFIPQLILDSDYSGVRITENLNKYLSSIGMTDAITLYYFDTDIDISYSTSGSFPSAFTSTFIKLTDEQIQSLENLETSVFLYSEIDENAAYYITPKPYVNGSKAYGLIIFTFDLKELMETISSMYQTYETDIYLFNYDEIISSSVKLTLDENINSEAEEIFLSEDLEGVFELTDENGDTYSIIKSYSTYNNVGYGIIIESEYYNESMNTFQKLIRNMIIIIFLIGCVVSLIMSIRLYKPLKEVVTKISNFTSSNEKNDVNELQKIYNVFENLDQKNSLLMVEMSYKNSLLKDYLLNSLLFGEESDSTEDEEKQLRKIFTYGSCFVVANIMYDDLKSYDLSDQGIGVNEKIVINNLEKLCDDSICFEIIKKKEQLLLIFNFNSEEDVEKIKNLSASVQSKYKEMTQKSITVSVGSVVNDLNLVKTSYIKCMHISQYRLIYGLNSMLIYDEIIDKNNNNISDDLSEYEIKELLINDQKDRLNQVLINKFINLNANSSPEKIFNEFYKYIRVIKSLASGNDEIFEKAKRISTNLPETNQELYENLLEISEDTIDFLNSKKQSKAKAVKIMEYLQLNFADTNLTLEKVAEFFNISPSYLSRYFKMEIGISPAKFLDGVRLEYASKLLTETNLSIKEIVGQCGYVDINNFTVKFKKAYGITPTNYRNNKLEK